MHPHEALGMKCLPDVCILSLRAIAIIRLHGLRFKIKHSFK
jgi:hypothetical protein